MSKRPNAMGRIEGEPKQKKDWGKIGRTTLYVALPVVLITLGVAGTLQYQAFIESVKQEGAAEYRLDKCEEFTDKKKNVSWLECNAA